MIFNLTKKNVIAHKPYFVYGVIANLRGMIKRRFSSFDAIVFQNSKGLHTLFSEEDIDMLFIDIGNGICKILEDPKHWQLCLKSKNAVCIVCLPKGKVKQNNIEVEDKLDLNAEITRAKKKQFKKIRSLIEPAPETAIPYLKNYVPERSAAFKCLLS
jgi:uncharacterized membrane protein (UPF0127 family)